MRKRRLLLDGVDQIALSLTARGLTTGEVSAYFAEIYGADVGGGQISRVTDAVIARLKQGEPSLAGRSASGNQIATINLTEIAERLGTDTYTGAYGLMKSEDPAPADRPTAVTRPVRDEGPHLSYAFQWFVFALMGFIGLGWAARQEYRTVNAEEPEEQDRAAERARRQAAKPRSDSDIEDELIDQHS